MNAAPPHRMELSRPFGVVEWFRPGEHERVERVLEALDGSGVAYLRTHLSWAEYLAEGGEAWFDWLLPRLAKDRELLPCIHYTPPSLSRTGRTSGAPRELKAYADFVDHVITRYGAHFEDIELWNEPNNLLDWDWREDPDFDLFCEMVGGAAYWAGQRGKRPVLGGPSPFDPYWVDLMGQRGVLGVCKAVGFHGFPGTWDSETSTWGGWDLHVGELRRILDRHNPEAEIWITETGYSTWRNDEIEQARRFLSALRAPADRLYWYGWCDLPQDVSIQEGFWFDPRHYHLGMNRADGQPKLLARLLREGGVPRVAQLAAHPAPRRIGAAKPIAVIGGSGFIGSNLAMALLRDGEDVLVVDNLSRPGVDRNLDWLATAGGARLHSVIADIRDEREMDAVLADCRAVYHLAAQTAVTTSLADPRADFEINGRGTLNVLEAVRRAGRNAPVIFASTNKVYGNLVDLEMVEEREAYRPADERIARFGIGEDRPLDFCTPYGCSKGLADQYVLDYAHSFGLRTAVLRMSCIYGPRQFGTEDQGWVAHFLIRALAGEALTLFGDGKQVRDILFVDDAVAAYRQVLAQIDQVSGRAFNLGGGPDNAVSLRAVLGEIERLTGEPVHVARADWRPGDQHYFVADTRRLEAELGWRARTGWRDGLRTLADWLATGRDAEPKAHRIREAMPL